jgi:hypothetical protein
VQLNLAKTGGEKRMKKPMIFVPLMVLLMLFVISPVMAAPKENKVPVVQITGATITAPTVCQRDGVTYPYVSSEWWAANGQKDSGVVAQRRDTGQVMKTTLIIDGTTTLQGLSFNNYDRMWKYAIFNPDVPFPPVPGYPTQVTTGSDSITHYDAIWEFQPQTGLSAYGGFEGNINLQIKDYNRPSMNVKMNCALHGFGSFEGQIIQLSVDSAVSSIWAGYLSKP